MNKEEIEQLMRFYAVETQEELVAVQARHIERLQEKLHERDPKMPIITRVREG